MADESHDIGSNGAIVKRDGRGRFIEGTRGGPGNPMARQVGQWRNALAETVSPQDLRDVLFRLLLAAKCGEPWAIKEVLDRCLGKPRQAEIQREESPIEFWKLFIDNPIPPELEESE